MDFGVLAAIISGFVALMGLFFGAKFWSMQSQLVEGQRWHIKQKNDKIDELQAETRQLRDRLDTVERNYYRLTTELNNCQNLADNYIAMIEGLKQEIARINGEHL